MEEKERNGTRVQIDNSSCIKSRGVSHSSDSGAKERPRTSKFLAFGRGYA